MQIAAAGITYDDRTGVALPEKGAFHLHTGRIHLQGRRRSLPALEILDTYAGRLDSAIARPVVDQKRNLVLMHAIGSGSIGQRVAKYEAACLAGAQSLGTCHGKEAQRIVGLGPQCDRLVRGIDDIYPAFSHISDSQVSETQGRARYPHSVGKSYGVHVLNVIFRRLDLGLERQRSTGQTVGKEYVHHTLHFTEGTRGIECDADLPGLPAIDPPLRIGYGDTTAARRDTQDAYGGGCTINKGEGMEQSPSGLLHFTEIALVRYGYADGLFRKEVAGQFNNRCMDITAMTGVKKGAREVAVMDDAEKIAKRYGTISYEILVKCALRAIKEYKS